MVSWNAPLLASAILLAVYVARRARRRSLGRLPPGPKGWPLIGNISDIPHEYSWLTYMEWAKIYGDIIYLEPLGSPTVILNNLEDAHELLDNRSAITADRPRMVMANELYGWEWDFAHMRHDERWRLHRKAFHQYFQQKNMPVHYPAIRKASLTLLNQLLMSPERFRSHLRQLASTVILKITYDHEVVSEDDYYVALADKALKALLPVVHVGSSIVDVIPALKHIPAWFPGAKFKKDGQVYSQWTLEMRDVPFEQAKKELSTGTIGPCFVADAIGREKESEEIIRNSAGIAYAAGSDTTVAIVASFLLAALHYPEIQTRAREELDAVTGGTRLPDFDDRPSLPYIDAIISEVFRWAPPTPLAVMHRSQEPDVYKGYYFPAGTTFIPNVYGIFHDEKRFPEPFKFRPERFLGENADFDPMAMGGFGYGRRICPGRHVALNSAWLAISQILTAFTISPKRDENGKEKLVPPQWNSGLISHPAPFEIDIIPRSKKAVEMIQRANLEV
ncbi:cytochrome P450 [Macrolepiota fuliginosa MF-IS2]|uniref:Cytochrome P450 n=1 Tax=Macrolepiota fuliginosa MF-IS2 TaxID=1400762 RepID=A0A9P6C2Y4_9AGAR|nr:cytochrome P450 [Macrolepiota fuliginosa MF-IS2]